MVGILDISSTPFDAAITLNGKDYGATPNTIKNLLIGDYNLVLRKTGYGTITKIVTIKENATNEVNENLPRGLEVTISSNPVGLQLWLDGILIGSTPYTATLSHGSHVVKLVNGKKVVEETISVAQNGKKQFEYSVIDGLTDIDGNTYKTVKIGNQEWMAENLKTTRYSSGSIINNVTESRSWTKTTKGAYCWYDNDIGNKNSYGALYNYYAVADSRNLCPVGWHVPTDKEWTVLIAFLGGESVAGGKLKATILWNSPNTGANNSSGFTALPGGYRVANGNFYAIESYGSWWSSTEYDNTYAWPRDLDCINAGVNGDYDKKGNGYSVRCVKDN